MTIKILLLTLLLSLSAFGVAFAANVFPTTLNVWIAGETIEEGWANALEDKIGVDSSAVTSSIDYLIKNASSILGSIAGVTATDSVFLVADGSKFVGESGATARTSLGLTIGTDVQAWDAQLDDIAALALTDSNFIVGDGSNWVAESGATVRTSLGLGSAAVVATDLSDLNEATIEAAIDTLSNLTSIGTLATGVWEATDIGVAHGGTGVSTLGDAGVLIGNTTGAVQVTTAGTAGQVLTSNGAGVDPTFQNSSATSTVPVMFVQRGRTTIADTATSTTITLDKSVSASSTFPMITLKGIEIGWTSMGVAAELRTLDGNGDKYTDLYLERNGSSGTVEVSWQVVSNPDFTVQTGAAALTAASSTTATIDSVATSTAFVATSATSTLAEPGTDGALVGVKFTDATTLTFIRGQTGGEVTTRFYVVEWAGATVQQDTIQMTSTSASSAALTSIDADKAFVIHNYGRTTDTDTNTAEGGMIMINLDDSTHVGVESEAMAGGYEVNFFVVEHPDILVQSGRATSTGTVAQTFNTNVRLDEAFTAVGSFMGNSMSDEPTPFGLMAYGTAEQELFDIGTHKARQEVASGTLTSRYFTVR